jgi:hypothetical protein
MSESFGRNIEDRVTDDVVMKTLKYYFTAAVTVASYFRAPVPGEKKDILPNLIRAPPVIGALPMMRFQCGFQHDLL